MTPTVQELFNTAIQLPLDMQALLAEKLIGYVETHIDPSIEKLHLAHAKRRKAEIQNGSVSSVDGVAALQKVRNTGRIDGGKQCGLTQSLKKHATYVTIMQ